MNGVDGISCLFYSFWSNFWKEDGRGFVIFGQNLQDWTEFDAGLGWELF